MLENLDVLELKAALTSVSNTTTNRFAQVLGKNCFLKLCILNCKKFISIVDGDAERSAEVHVVLLVMSCL